jgi:hypothetical protein
MTQNIWNRYVESAAERYGVPPSLINSVISAESGGQPGAVSSAGAGGYMQLMPDTFAELRRKHGLGPDRMDPETNIQAGTAYLGQLYKQFGNWPDAISAYNAGPNRWAQVKAGTREAPRETQAYVPKVLAGFNQGKGADVPQNRSLTEDQLLELSRNGQTPGQTTLLNVTPDEMSKDYLSGAGNLLNFGQTPSQPPRIDPAAMPGSTQTDRLDVSGRINELLQQYMQKPQQTASSPLQYALAGMSGAVQPLAGVHDRKVGLGEMLGALGGGLTRGTMAGDEAQRQQQGGELEKLLKIGGYQNQNRTAALNEANAIIENRYRTAATDKLLRPEAPETYTLAPGAQRRDAAGNIVAENPPTPPVPRQAQTVQTAEGVFVLNPDGSLGQRVGSPVSAVQKQSPQEREAILESDKKLESGVATIGTLRQALTLNDKAFEGATAGARAWADRNLAPGEWGGTVTTEFQNLVESGLLTQMKDIFGPNPTEGERKVLLDLGASVNKSKEERTAIINNAIAAAEARVARERQRAEALRKGTYYTEALPEPGSGGSGGGNPPDPLGLR